MPYPPTDGARIRAYNTIKRLSKNNKVSVLTLTSGDETSAHFNGLSAITEDGFFGSTKTSFFWSRVLIGLLKGRSLSVIFFEDPKLKSRIQKRLGDQTFDLIVVHSSGVAPYVLGVPVKKVMDFVDMDSVKWREFSKDSDIFRKALYRYEAWALKKLENKCVEEFDLCTVATNAEHEELMQRPGEAAKGWFVNGVDLEYFSRAQSQEYDDNLIVFLGKMDYWPNVDAVKFFTEEILPMVRSRFGKAKFRIVGANPAREVQKLAQRHKNVEVTGRVDDVRPLVTGAALSVAPLRVARGTQNKVLESLAMRVPVVTNSLTLKGVDMRPGIDVLVGDTPEEFAKEVCSVLGSKTRREQFAAAGQQRVIERHNWDSAMDSFEELVASYVLSTRQEP
jgi:hypothetical protein